MLLQNINLFRVLVPVKNTDKTKRKTTYDHNNEKPRQSLTRER